jgi:hypothetical protein
VTPPSASSRLRSNRSSSLKQVCDAWHRRADMPLDVGATLGAVGGGRSFASLLQRSVERGDATKESILRVPVGGTPGARICLRGRNRVARVPMRPRPQPVGYDGRPGVCVSPPMVVMVPPGIARRVCHGSTPFWLQFSLARSLVVRMSLPPRIHRVFPGAANLVEGVRIRLHVEDIQTRDMEHYGWTRRLNRECLSFERDTLLLAQQVERPTSELLLCWTTSPLLRRIHHAPERRSRMGSTPFAFTAC